MRDAVGLIGKTVQIKEITYKIKDFRLINVTQNDTLFFRTEFKGGDKSVGVFHPLQPAIARIHHNLKNTFDPAGIFNPGRMYTDF